MWLTRLQAEWMFDSGLMDFCKSHQKERAGSRIAVLFSQMLYLVFLASFFLNSSFKLTQAVVFPFILSDIIMIIYIVILLITLMLLLRFAHIKNLLWILMISSLFFGGFVLLFVFLQSLTCITYLCCGAASTSSVFCSFVTVHGRFCF